MNPREEVLKLDPYVPGRSQEEIASEFNLKKEDIIKLGSNENPWGASKKAMKAIEDEIKNINRYPESDLRELTEEIARYMNVKEDQIIIGGDGADEIIEDLAKTFINPDDEFIVPIPSYTYYEFIFVPYGAVPVYAKWDLESNSLDIDSVLEAITDKTKMIFLANPNNPTGTLIPKKDLSKLAEATDALIVIDEAYGEYSKDTNVDLIEKYDNIFIMKTMSKVMGLAGLRIGYGIASSKIIDYINRIKPVFSLTSLSYVAALNTLKDNEFIESSIKKGIESREYLYKEMSKIPSLNVFKSESNFIFVGIKDTEYNAAELSRELLKRGVIIRDCTSFKGIDDQWIRVSIGTEEENKKFIKILNEVLD